MIRRNIFLFSILGAFIFIGAGCSLFTQKIEIHPITLEYWRQGNETEAINTLARQFQIVYPNITIKVTNFREEDFEQKLLEAFAEDRGPDLFSVPNVSIGAWENNILPMPKTITFPVQTKDENQKIVTQNKTDQTLTTIQMRSNYVEMVANELIRSIPEKEGEPPQEKIIGLPYSADTLALFVNKDILTANRIAEIPNTWQAFAETAAKLTIKNAQGGIVQSGAALGRAQNIANAPDILLALMGQNGATLQTPNGAAAFARPVLNTRGQDHPSLVALRFYKNFANPQSAHYTWNDTFSESLESFIAGKTAFFFGYPSDAEKIRMRAPKLNLAIAPLPQIDAGNPVNIGRYPVEFVSKKTGFPNEAWNFLLFASQKEQVESFLTNVKRPTALRSLIAQQLTDPSIAPFATQVLTAQSWYRGKDYSIVKEAFTALIETVPEDPRKEAGLITTAEQRINQTLR